MKTILALLIALSACGFDRGYSPDAAQHIADAAIDSPGHDAAPVGSRGCMGNLPNSRTVTINTGDPIPASLINELQDSVIGAKRKAFTRTFYPTLMVLSGAGTWVCVQNPDNAVFAIVNKSTFAGVNAASWGIPADVGDRITGLDFEIYGNGTVDILGSNVVYSDNAHSASTNLTGTNPAALNIGAAWSTFTLVPFTPQIVGSRGFLKGQISVSDANFYFGPVTATFDRL